MPKKKLKPALPKDEVEILEKGFAGNVAAGKKFITDGHSIVLAERVTKGWEIKRPEDGWRPVDDLRCQALWDSVLNRKEAKAEFIGCGKVGEALEGDDPVFVAVIRKEDTETVTVNPWILQFAVSIVGANILSVDSGAMWIQNPIVLYRGADAVGMVMPMRFTGGDLEQYNLTGPAVPLGEGIHAVS